MNTCKKPEGGGEGRPRYREILRESQGISIQARVAKRK